MEGKFETSEDGIDPVDYISDYFSHLTSKEISVLVGSIALLQTVDLKILQDVLELEQIEVEEKIGRLLQSDLLDGEFSSDQFILSKFNYKIKKQSPNLTLDDRTFLAYLKSRFEVSFDELQNAFQLNYASIIHILSNYIAQGLLTPQRIDDDTYQYIVHFRYNKRTAENITDFETQIVGFFQLLGKTTIKEVATGLKTPEHKVLSSLTQLILGDMVLTKFSISSGLFSGVKLEIQVDKFQVFFKQRSMQVLSNNERKFIGYLSLRRKVTIEELSAVLSKNKTSILKLAAHLYATNQINIALSGDTLSVVEFRPTSVNRSLEVLSKIHSFNYRMLVGLIQTQQQISLSEIAEKMEIPESDVTSGLITCYIEGIVDGYLDNRGVFRLNAIQRGEDDSEITLDRWERIILGALIAEEIIAWPKIAVLLEVDRVTARNRAFEFISRGISKTIAKDTVLKLENKPSLPPLEQVEDLDELDQLILGYLKMYPKVNVGNVAKEFDLHDIDVFRTAYYLTGSGLIKLSRDGKDLIVEATNTLDPQYSISELDLIIQQVVRGIELAESKEINLRQLASEIELPGRELKNIIYKLNARGYYDVTIKGLILVLKSGLRAEHDAGVCLFCSTPLDQNTQRCPNCGNSAPACGVCKGSLNSNEKLLACPHCKNLSHANHIKQWLQVKGECPFCRSKIRISELMIQQPLL